MEGPLQSPRPFRFRIKKPLPDPETKPGDLGMPPSVAPSPYSTTPYWQRLTKRVTNNQHSFQLGVAWKTLIFRGVAVHSSSRRQVMPPPCPFAISVITNQCFCSR